MKRITIKDLAVLLNLSPSTISRALSDHPDISDETKKRVREVAKKMNYLPNITAKSLRTQQSGLIALVLPELPMFFTPNLISAANEYVHQNGYNLVFLQTNNSLETEKEIVNYCYNIGVDGVMISLTDQSKNLDHLQILKGAQIPVVLIDRILENIEYPTVTIDGVETAFKAVHHLIQNGHKHIVGLFGSPELDMTQKRMKGFKQALLQAGIQFSEKQIFTVPNPLDLKKLFHEILSSNPNTTAFFTMSDSLMVQIYHEIKTNHYKIPEDFSLISISNGKAPLYLFPNIDHILHSGYEVGKKACEVLLSLISKNPTDLIHPIKTELVICNSVKSFTESARSD